MSYRAHYAIAAGLLLTSSGLAQGAAYKWVDDHGTTHYSQHRPTGEDSVKVIVSSPPSSVTAPGETQKRLESQLKALTEQREARDKAAEEKAKSVAETKQRRDTCAKARSNLTGLTTGGRKRIIGADGEARYLSEEEQHRLLIETQKQIDEYCD